MMLRLWLISVTAAAAVALLLPVVDCAAAAAIATPHPRRTSRKTNLKKVRITTTQGPGTTKPAPTPKKEEDSSKSPFPRWPKPFVQANGDYRDEQYLEEVIGGKLYSKQTELPKLPVPSIDETIDTFLPTALPLLLANENKDEQEQSLLDAVSKFPKQAEKLQERLEERAFGEFANSSWLQHLWNTQGYLQCQDPIACLISYFLFVPDDKTLPENNGGLKRAAAVLHAMATSRKLICSGEMTPEAIGDNIMDSSFFKYVFHTCRIPRDNQDCYHMYDPSQYRHCIVACNNRFYAMDFCDNDENPFPVSVLLDKLQTCVQLATTDGSSEQPEMGWLTSTNRTFWSNARQELLEVGGDKMQNALKKIESAAFVLNYDHDQEPQTKTDAARLFWHGGETSGGNRWFDKTVQVVCTKNGKVGYQGEHSMLDAAPIISLISRILKTTYKRLSKKEEKESSQEEDDAAVPLQREEKAGGGVHDVFDACWSSPATRAKAEQLTKIAKEHHQQLTGEYDIQVHEFQGYGKKFLKNADLNADGFVQMAMQLASYRLFGEQVGTYEAALTRNFLHGRTETTRTVSPASQAFVQEMGFESSSPGENTEKKLDLLRQAISTHEEYQNKASMGRGVDRHFFGLSSMLKEGEESPDLFSHPLFTKSKTWRLTTSFVTYFPGFGPVVDDGIGIGYGVESNACIFTCTSLVENNYLEKFCNLLDDALVEMGDLAKEMDT